MSTPFLLLTPTTPMNLLLLFGSATLCLAWLLPGHYFPWWTFQQEFAAALGALMIGAAASMAKRFTWPALALIALATAAVPLVQFATGQIRFLSDAALAAAYVAGFGLCISAGATLVRQLRVDVAGYVLTGLAAAAFASVAMAFMQWFDVGTGALVDAAPPAARYYANFGQPNNLSTALAMGICAVLLGHSRNKIGPLVATLAVGLLGWCMVMTQSRTGWLFAALLAVGLMALRHRAALRIPPLAVVAGLVSFGLANWAWQPLNDLLLMSSQSAAAERLTSGSLRLIHWQVMLDAISQHPWQGYGWTQAALAQQAGAINHPPTGEAIYSSHNIALDLLVWNGVPIGMFLIGALIWWLVRQLRLCRDAERAFPLAAVGAVILHGLLELPLEYAFFLLPTGLLMGALDAHTPPGPAFTTARGAFVVPLLALTLLTAWIGAEYVKVDEAGRVLRFVAMGIGTDKVAVAPEPDVALLDRPRNLHRFMLTPARIDDNPEYLRWVRDVAMRNPMAPAMLRHALAAGLNGQPAEAELVLIRLCKLHMNEMCDQGRASWAQLQAKHPQLKSIPFPTQASTPRTPRPPSFPPRPLGG